MKDSRIYFAKMLEYTLDAQRYIKGVNYKEFCLNSEKLSACSFAICQISELAARVSDEDKKRFTAIPWVAMRAMRNRIVHNYDSINREILYDTITKDLPKLEQEIKQIQAILGKERLN